jgi:hypothetical protein
MFDRIAQSVAKVRDLFRSQVVYDALHAEGLIASPTPSPEQRGKVSAALEALGFRETEGTDADGNRQRQWAREVSS